MHEGRGQRVVRRVAEGLAYFCVLFLAAGLVVLAAGSAAGRWRIWVAHNVGAQTGVGHDDALFLTPVSATQIHDGDVVVMGRGRSKPAVYKVKMIIDTFEGRAQIIDEQGKPQEVSLPSKVWRLSRDISFVGFLIRLLAGPVQAGILVLGGLALIARAESRRHRAAAGPAPPVPGPAAVAS
jgi:hypothetical protein